jgi:hypothetical protein
MSDHLVFPDESATPESLVAPYVRHLHDALEGRQGDEEAERVGFWIGNLVLMGRPEDAWPVLVAAIEELDDERLLDLVGAGDLESLIEGHGEVFIDRIEVQGRASQRFRRALRGVWATESPVRARIDALVTEEP